MPLGYEIFPRWGIYEELVLDREYIKSAAGGVSFWINNQDTTCAPMVGFSVTTSAGNRNVEFLLGSGTTTYTSGYYLVYLNQNTAGWQRIERDIHAIVDQMTSGVTVSAITRIYTRGKSYRLDDVLFSNSLTVEHNVLGPGVIGHILRNRSTNSLTFATVDRWFHYDQVGSVMAESNSAGALAVRHDQDAFGILQAAWDTGLPKSAPSGWHHNSKNIDPDSGMVYMYQRWYNPHTGTFLSKAPMPVQLEHAYGFASGSPAERVDPQGTLDGSGDRQGQGWGIPVLSEACALVTVVAFIDKVGPRTGADDKVTHCVLSCIMSFYCGLSGALVGGEVGEWLDELPGQEGYSDEDRKANNRGAFEGLEACSTEDCYTRCQKARASGSLPPNGVN